MNVILILITICIGVLRFAIVPRLGLPTAEGSYEAFAHCFVGGLIGAWLANRNLRLCGWLALLVTVLEVVMFAVQKINSP